MSQSKQRNLARTRATIRDCAAILSVPWPVPSVSEADQRAAARGLNRSSHLPSPIQEIPFRQNKN